ncbi:hypothetical protein MKW92_033454 [Papaver armeniacum]|nr:hypothetical protein MKW92_033454 [Papaver armeniacum]
MIPLLVIHFFIFLFLINTISADQEPKCDTFDCKVLGKVYPAPYSDTSHPDCRVLPINCTTKTPTLTDMKGNRSYQVKNSWQNRTFLIHDQLLQQQLDSKNCNAIQNIELPKSPYFTFGSVVRSSNLTFIKCKHKVEYDHVHHEIYEGCDDDYVLYYRYPEQITELSRYRENNCSVVSLPLIDNPPSAVKDNDPFSLINADFVWKWELSPECNWCSVNGGYCRTDYISGPFKCVMGIEMNMLLIGYGTNPLFHAYAAAPKSKRGMKIGIGVGCAAAASLLTALAFFLIRQRRKNDLHKNSTLISRSISPDLSMQPDPEKGSSYFNTPIFTYKELEEATNNFDSSKELGDGGFGTVYYDKSDVYSFGVVLCELISSKPAVDISRHRHEINLSTMALNKIHGDALHELVDMSLGFDTNASVRKTITLVAELAYRCLQQDTDARPSMAEVLEVLKEIEVEGSKVVKPGELTDDAKLLKNYPPVSPNSVTDKWASITSTPNTSS